MSGFKFGSFLLGGAIGAVAALLYAPRKGEETRAIVANKIDDVLDGRCAFSFGNHSADASSVSDGQAAGQRSADLRQKIESARATIAEQVAKNAAAARDAINDKIPVASEKINQAADVVKAKIQATTSKVSEMASAASAQRNAAKEDEYDMAASTTDQAPSAPAPGVSVASAYVAGAGSSTSAADAA
ncbi:MAG: YtxH domain-containing protein [Coriobacteriales bacterium]|jgi:gas vesicle protein|nr:YtxH domain-containing protein [Coriobacteriales bacterium]